eukprot:TRINITY_DN3268_c0_g2_i2.p5 TRINITY_DN3268_c0_g2~~TRINITY_DN3268_c0_g2_i2.p5  ORF type:complete len:169 (+),score=35.63 TRINITY_DN3268_c0_g2_i2:3896-4402(+)
MEIIHKDHQDTDKVDLAVESLMDQVQVQDLDQEQEPAQVLDQAMLELAQEQDQAMLEQAQELEQAILEQEELLNIAAETLVDQVPDMEAQQEVHHMELQELDTHKELHMEHHQVLEVELEEQAMEPVEVHHHTQEAMVLLVLLALLEQQELQEPPEADTIPDLATKND